ncbi:MAG TPA: hypothetical protein DCY27_06515 [Desulfobacterales bacterium]|nr:hypothetical protein [Desulfobacterales bacterium]
MGSDRLEFSMSTDKREFSMAEHPEKLHVGYGTAAGYNSLRVGREAAQEALHAIPGSFPTAVLVFASVKYNLVEVLHGIHEVITNAPVLGATTAGEICNAPQKESVVVIVLASPYLRVRVGVGQGVSRDWRQAVNESVSAPDLAPLFSPADSRIWQELTLQGKSVFALLFSPGNTKTADSRSFEILEELKRLSLGRIRIVGGSAADDWRLETNYVLWGKRAYPDSMLLAVFETQLRFGIAMAHGFHPTSRRATVTRCGNHQVLELDGQPAAEIYSRLQGTSSEALAGKHLKLTTGQPLGTPMGWGEYSINMASFFTAAGGVRLAQPVAEGTTLTIMEANQEELIAAGGEAARKALLRHTITDPGLVLVFVCALRSPLLGDRNREAIDTIKDLVKPAPVVGFYSFGEQGLADNGTNQHNNYVISMLVLSRQLSYGAQVSLENERLRGDLLTTRDQLQRLLSCSPAVIYSCKPSENYDTTYISENVTKQLGYEPREITENPKFFGLHIHPDDCPRIFAMANGLPEKGFLSVEYRFRHKNGSWRWIRDDMTLIRDAQGQPLEIIGYMLDVTERREAQELLKDNEQFLQDIFDSIPDVLDILALDLTIIRTNQAGRRFNKQPSPGRKCYEVYHSREVPCELCPVQQTIRTGKASRGTVAIHVAGAGDRFLEIRSFPMMNRTSGQLAAVIAHVRDVTEYKRAQDERLQCSKLESLATLAGGIAHDFNNILTAILGNIGLVLLQEVIKSEVQDRLMQAQQACFQAQTLARQLLTFAKGGAPIKRIVCLAKLLKESVTLTLSGSNTLCDLSIPAELWAVEADAGQLGQAFSNLLMNADQAMPEGGVLKVAAENLIVQAKSALPLPGGKYVKLTFTDQGIGISPKYLNKIFDPYFSTRHKGSGLGLTTAYAIIKNHAGIIQVDSQVGIGTTFTVYLPATEKETVQDEPRSVESIRGQGKILVMDDEKMVRDVLGRMLMQLGYTVELVCEGSQVLERFVQAKKSGSPFDAVILDLTIPGGLGGKSTIRELLKIDPQVKAIVSSGYYDDPVMANYQDYGFCEVIAKPYRITELGEIVRRVITDSGKLRSG